MSGRAPSLQRRLLALVLGLVATVWVGTAALTWFDVRHELDELLDGHLAQAAALLVVQQVGELEDEDHAVDAPSLHRHAPKIAFQVFHEGRLALRSANAPAVPMIEPSEGFRSGFRSVRIGDTDWRVFATYGAERDIQVYVGEQQRSRASILWALLRGTLQPMAVALPLLALAVWWAVRRGTAPLRSLGRTLAQREPLAIQPVVVDGAPSEMKPMVDALNDLFGRIGALMDSERRFTADAAHELRTPIAAIRAQAQVALAEADDALRRHALQATLQGCDRATRLVEQMLTLSRLESADAPVLAVVDLSELVRGVVGELAPKALAKQQRIELDAEPACRVQGQGTLLTVLVRNLVDNAVRYSPAGASVHVGVIGDGGDVRLTVQDSGSGLEHDALQRLGERFFRVFGSGQEGSGLGWSIVRRIAHVHAAQVRVQRSARLGGLAVEVVWKNAAQQAGSTALTRAVVNKTT
jgi:two-component system sensor histidine kinase QseC